MRRALTIVAVVLCAASFLPAQQVQTPVPPTTPTTIARGSCCLCTLDYNGVDWVWTCPCTAFAGAVSCTIDAAGCTNVGVCP